MPPSSGPGLRHALVYLLLITVIAAAQQQQHNAHRRSPPENAALDPSNGHRQHTRAIPQDGRSKLSATHRTGKDTAIIPVNERALATFAPAESLPAVRALPARSSPSNGGLSRQTARSLQDWQVEDIILLATVDGKIHARERHTGAPRWELEVDRSMVETVYHKNNKSVSENASADEDLLWIVEPSQDGALYVYAPGSRLGMQRLGLTVKQLVEELSPYAGEDPPVVYTAEKKNTLYTVDAATGNILKSFSAAGSVTNTDRSCRRSTALESLEDSECEQIGTLTLGRTEYTVGIQDKVSGEPICTIKYFEWGPNIRDKDLQGQYVSTLDNKYVYSKHDGSVMALEHSFDSKPGRHSPSAHSLMYSHKFSSPVARVYDVVRPFDLESQEGEASLVVLPQPVGPVNDQWPTTDNVFVNCTETGSWYALSEQSYPLVTDGASRALCYTDDVYMGHVSLGQVSMATHRAKLVGIHPLSILPSGQGRQIPLIGGPEPDYPVQTVDGSTPPSWSGISDVPNDSWSILRPSPMTILLALALLSTLPPIKSRLIKAVNRARKVLRNDVTQEDPNAVVQVVPTAQNHTAAVESLVAAEAEERKVRFPEPAEETIFPQQTEDDSEKETKPDESVDDANEKLNEKEPSPTHAENQENLPPSDPDTSSLKPEKEKKARRGVRGGRKLKEKKLEQEQAQQRKRANSQTAKKASEVQDITRSELAPSAQVAIPQVITVDASESPTISGKIQINNLVVNTDRLIGRGSAGTCVFEGCFGKRDVAVKRMLSQYYELASQEVVFLQENDDHPNVIRYYCQERDQNFLYIAVELCQASLWDLFYPEQDRQEQLGGILSAIQQDVPGALKQIALGLRHLHARRIIHRDIKPQNILLARPNPTRKGPHLLISDFGLCKTLPENMSTLIDATGNAGTSGWKAPELISQPKESVNGHSTASVASDSPFNSGGTGGVKRAADIFSLGCLFFWVLTGGCHPFDDKEGWAQIREFNIKKNNLQNMHKLDLGSDTEEPMQLITHMLSHRPEDRPSVDSILQHPFFWKPAERLGFLCDVSDHFEREPRDPPSWQLELLEMVGPSVIEKGDFLKTLPLAFVETLGKQRKYTGSRMLDLLRALRNKKNHYEDMPEDVKRKVGPLPAGYLQFWTVRFPKLLMACYEVVKECELETTERFIPYFEVKAY